MLDENKIISIIKEDKWMMELLKLVESLHLPDWWICAGFVRSIVWDILHDFEERTPLADIDVIYFDPKNIDEAADLFLEEKLSFLNPTVPWSVKNEARMHVKSNMPPYQSSVDAISKFPETATAIGVKLDDQDRIVLTAPHGIKDLINLEVKPTIHFQKKKERIAIYKNRINQKNWKLRWNQLKIHYN